MIEILRYIQSLKKIEKIFNKKHFDDERCRHYRRELRKVHN